MNISMLKGKIHRATVVQAELNYVGCRYFGILKSTDCRRGKWKPF